MFRVMFSSKTPRINPNQILHDGWNSPEVGDINLMPYITMKKKLKINIFGIENNYFFNAFDFIRLCRFYILKV